jgi:hypothetical protein
MLRHFEASPNLFTEYLRDIFSAIEAGDWQKATAIAQFKNQPVKLLGEF